MNREPDWEALAEVNFLMYRRMTEHLNAALAAIYLIKEGDTSQEDADKPEGFWEERAHEQVMEALSLHNAWASLVRHQNGETFLQQHLGYFPAQELMTWVAKQLQLPTPSDSTQGMMLTGNRESLQEALLLLRSCAYTLGARVRLIADGQSDGIWFRIHYDTGQQNTPNTLDGLLNSLIGNWRSQSAAFELRRARDFLNMNQCQLRYKVLDQHCELSFFVGAVGKDKEQVQEKPQLQPKAKEATAVKADDTLKPKTSTKFVPDRTTQVIPTDRPTLVVKSSETADVRPEPPRAVPPTNGVEKPPAQSQPAKPSVKSTGKPDETKPTTPPSSDDQQSKKQLPSS